MKGLLEMRKQQAVLFPGAEYFIPSVRCVNGAAVQQGGLDRGARLVQPLTRKHAGIAIQIDVEDAVGVSHQVDELKAAVKEEL